MNGRFWAKTVGYWMTEKRRYFPPDRQPQDPYPAAGSRNRTSSPPKSSLSSSATVPP
jgi:hypothetical protein